MTTLTSMATLQSGIDAAEDDLNSLISLKRSLMMTVQELTEMDVDPKAVNDQLATVNKSIAAAAAAYATATVTNLPQITKLKGGLRIVNDAPESPVDFNKTQVKRLPLAADSLKMNVQYFSRDTEEQSAANFLAQIGGFVSDSLSIFGDDFSSQASSQAKSQASSQIENHDVVGTLVVSIVCTHKNASVLAPFIMDVDKAVRVWNQMFPDDKLEMTTASMTALTAKDEVAGASSISIVSGASYGSSFVGMVYVLRTESTQTSQSMSSVAASMQEQFDVGGWFASESGGFGVDESFSSDIKNLLSSQNVTSHVSLITMGAIPSIKSNQVQIGVKTFAKFDPAEMMDKLATLQNSTQADQQSVAQSAAAARAGGQMVALENAKTQSVMSGLAALDEQANQILDINSMMTALEDYINKASAGDVGVPINYFIKPITKLQIAQMWVAKYYPKKYVDFAGDDSTPDNKPAPGPDPTPAPAAAPEAPAEAPAPSDPSQG